MKKKIILLLGLLSVVTSFLNASNKVIISVTITGDIKEQVEYTSSENGSCFYGFPRNIQIDSYGNFIVTLNIDKPTFFQPLIGTYSYGTLVVEPGSEYEVRIDLNSKEKSIQTICNNEKGQILYNKLLKKNLNSSLRNYERNEDLLNIKEEIKLARNSEIEELKKLLEDGEISEPFFKIVKLDRECFYSVLQSEVAQRKYFKILRNNANYTDDVKKMWKEAFQNSPITNANIASSHLFYRLVKNYISYKQFTSDSFDKDKLMEIYKQGSTHTHNINLSKNYLNDDKLEYYQARYLYESATKMNFEEELIRLFDNFKKDYPESEYSNFLCPIINPISNFLDNKKTNNEQIKYIPNYENINSLNECLLPFKGRKVYIDIWASWCIPCRTQFKHKEKLKKILDAENVEMVYISIDKGDRYAKKWKELINFYNLEGNHIRANGKLYSNLTSIFNANGSITIPWYLIIDEQGNILEKHAKSPSQIKELEMQMKKK